jgi:thymidylate kinase
MLIIISGCDRSGKTSIANKFIEETNYQYTHFSSPKDKEDGKHQYFNFVASINPNENYLCDRFYEGEFVYAPIYRGYQLDYAKPLEDTLLYKTNAMYIYVKADLDVIKERIKEVGEEYVKDEDLEKVIDNYEKFITHCGLPYLILENNNMDKDKFEKTINLKVKEIEYYSKVVDKLLNLHKEQNLPMSLGNIIPQAMKDSPDGVFTHKDLSLSEDYEDFWFTSEEVLDETMTLLDVDVCLFNSRN